MGRAASTDDNAWLSILRDGALLHGRLIPGAGVEQVLVSTGADAILAVGEAGIDVSAGLLLAKAETLRRTGPTAVARCAARDITDLCYRAIERWDVGTIRVYFDTCLRNAALSDHIARFLRVRPPMASPAADRGVAASDWVRRVA